MMVPDFFMTLSASRIVLAFWPSVVPRLRHVHTGHRKSCFNSVSCAADCRIRRRCGVFQAHESAMRGGFMLDAILAYHVESEVKSWSAEEDAALMVNLRKAHGRINELGKLGPAARLGDTNKA